jgi:hypothetical protein
MMMLVGCGPPIIKPVEQAPHSVTRPIVRSQFMETLSLLATVMISALQSMRAEQWRKDSLDRRAWIQA